MKNEFNIIIMSGKFKRYILEKNINKVFRTIFICRYIAFTLLFKSGKIIHLGPSGETQTLGLADPNRAFYQLNYTRIFDFSA